MRKALFILSPESFELIYGDEHRKSISRLVDVEAEPQTAESIGGNPEMLKEIEILFTGWNGPQIDRDFLEAAPNLKMVFYGAGSIRPCVTDTFWDRGVRITSAYAANAIPVAEYTLSTILFSLKRGWQFIRQVRESNAFTAAHDVPGAYRTTVGLISFGMIGKLVRERLMPFDLTVLGYDPYLNEETADRMNIDPVSLENLFGRSEVVSLHTPLLESTRHLIRGEHFASMKHNATFINTSRGAVVRQDEMIEVLRQRPDLQAVLDVTDPEPPPPDSPLYRLPNVVLTPHLAGSMGPECRRMGAYMVGELRRYLEDKPLKWEITRDRAAIMA